MLLMAVPISLDSFSKEFVYRDANDCELCIENGEGDISERIYAVRPIIQPQVAGVSPLSPLCHTGLPQLMPSSGKRLVREPLQPRCPNLALQVDTRSRNVAISLLPLAGGP